MVYYATHKRDKTYGHIFEGQILKRYTPTGSKRHGIRKRNPETKKFEDTKIKSYGNYWTYVKKAAAICNDDSIRKQMRRNKAVLHKAIDRAKESIRKSIEYQTWHEYMSYHTIYSKYVALPKSEKKRLKKKISKAVKLYRKHKRK